MEVKKLVYLFLCCVSVLLTAMYVFLMIRSKHILKIKNMEIMMLREIIKTQIVKENDREPHY